MCLRFRHAAPAIRLRVSRVDTKAERRPHHCVEMTRHDKVLRRVRSGTADQAMRFGELCSLLTQLGFAERQRGGSHRIFSSAGVSAILNLQAQQNGTAKPYQVRHVRDMIKKYQLASLDDEGLPDAR